MSLSVLILTLNEEANLPNCLASLAWCDDIVVLDSYSTDRTVQIATAAGARVVQRHFDSWDRHQNWAMEHIAFKHPWVYYTDADEVVPEDLRQEMLSIVSAPSPPHVAYRVRYKNFFCRRWIKHCGIYPVWVLRLFRPETVRWERLVNPVPVVNGSVGRLNGHFHHYSFHKGYEAWFSKHNHYSSQEAQEGMRSAADGFHDWQGLFCLKDASRRRSALKELSFRLPCRPLLRFLYMYVLRLGMLDGIAGFRYCRLLAIYEYMIVLKMQEYGLRARGLSL
ncbi:MAG TPA: glycosyltransferase family 2 protein [Nitrospira sp.]|nr:glycosyltransferase family 2 protein [Nitrospira sp.]